MTARRKTAVRGALVVGALLALAWRAGPPAARAAPVAPAASGGASVGSPIERVIVYSDQARVFRSEDVVVGAVPIRATIATLPPAAWPDTVRVECPSAEITHVEVSRTWERLPRQAEGRALLARIERLLDEVRALDDEQRLLRTELGFVEALQPAAQRPKPDKEPPFLFVDAWRRVLQWAEARAAKLRARLAALPALRHDLEQQLQALRVAGRKLLPDAASGPALRVAVTLRGSPGVHRVGLSYVVGGVRWVPSYDLHYDPQSPAVEASYYALVTQSSGEDWREARLAFSTIMPSHLLAVPELPTWTLGRTTGFTPRPRPRWESRPAAWQAPAPTPPTDATMVELEEAIGRGPALVDGEDRGRRTAAADTSSIHPAGERLRSLVQGARHQRDIIKLNCLNDKLVQVEALGRMAVAADQESRVASDQSSRDHAQAKLRVIVARVQALRQEAESCVGEEANYDGRVRELERRVDETKQQIYRTRVRAQLAKEAALASPAAAPPPEPAFDGDDAVLSAATRGPLRAEPAARRSRRAFSFGSGSSAPPRESVPWTDTGYRPPYLDPDLPAAAAKGHRFTMDAPGRHSVAATGTAVRVPLGRERFAVTPVYKIVPGRSLAAYLTAEVFNSTGRPVLRGHANLFTGVTYSGQTKLETAVPGAKLLLPLGVDEGVKVNRVSNQRTVATGVIFKDEVSEYTVTIEIANHRRHPIQVDVEDQVPVKANADASVEGFEASPAMTGPALDGKVTYKGTVGAGSVQKLTLKFRIVRPKNWELRQHDG